MARKNPYTRYQTDADLETDGIWIEEPYFRVKARRAGGKNMNYKKVADRIMRPVRKLVEAGELPDRVVRDYISRIFSEAVVVDWESRPADFDIETCDDPSAAWERGIVDPENPEADELLPVTPENIRKALNASGEFLDRLVEDAKSGKFYRAEIEDDTGN